MATTFRQSARAGLKAVLDTFLAANPTLLVSVYDHRPPGFNPPTAFVGNLTEPSIRTDSGVRTRHMSADVVIVHRPADNDSTSDQMDVLVDGILDALTAAPHAVSGAILTGEMSVQDGEITGLGGHRGGGESGVVYVSTVISVHVEIFEGRD